ncbi:MAG: TlpA family protein disulfide reductase [Acidobacteriota bacterium]|nr:MAG: TlpA family protein disulfide reductase [Acidobacteriota bacterium]
MINAPQFRLRLCNGGGPGSERGGQGLPSLLVFFETDCPTCRLLFPYLNRLRDVFGEEELYLLGISQDAEAETRLFIEQLSVGFPIALDEDLAVTRRYDFQAVPAVYLIDASGQVIERLEGFDKERLNAIAARISGMAGREAVTIADQYDGAPARMYGCVSRHLEGASAGPGVVPVDPYAARGARASRVVLSDDEDPFEYCLEAGFDPLPVIPPTVERVEKMLAATTLAPEQAIGLVPPNYGAATVEKIAANAVMAGCRPEMMRVLIPLVRAACYERLNLHGAQATTHFAAPLVIVNGPVRRELDFACGSNVFSNIARANSSLGRALQLILTNIGGARPGEIDMSALGNPGKFSYCIAENEEASPWEPLHVEHGFRPDQSAISIFCGEAPHGVSEHNARRGSTVLKAISRALATVWTYRACMLFEAFVIFCPEHVNTLKNDGFTKQQVRDFLFENTGIPVRAFDDDDGEGLKLVHLYERVTIDGEPHYRKFAKPEAIRLLVAGGGAGKFSAVIGSWASGPRGSQMVTYPIDG